MKASNMLVCLCSLATISALAVAQQGNTEGGCVATRAGLQFRCPQGWFLLNDEPNQLAIGNCQRDPHTPKTVFGGKGKAWISIQSLPSAYRDLAQWIYAGHKLAPEAVESRFTVKNGDRIVEVTCLESPAKSGPAYISDFFEIDGVPTLLELNYRAEDPKREDYRSTMKAMIAAITKGSRGR